jgi:phospholipase C
MGRGFALALIGVVGMTQCAQRSNTAAPGLPALPAYEAHQRTGGHHFDHIVIMIQENRSFDDFFATYPGADGATTGKLHDGKTIELKEGILDSDSLEHIHFTFEKEYDRGRMDGFDLITRVIQHGEKVPAGTYPYQYVNPKFIKPYWVMANQYVLADHMFPTQSSASFTAHQDLIAGDTDVGHGDNVIDFPSTSTWGCNGAPGTVTSLITPTGRYLLDQGPFPCFGYRTIRDLLDRNGLTWKYFTNTSPGFIWNAFDAIRIVRNSPEWARNIKKPQTIIFRAIKTSMLPAVSWIIPDNKDSDHPGNGSDSGPSWIASVVNAIGESQYWNSTAIIVLWDDWGGEYDNVPPPQLDGQGLGIRVPMLVIAPYAKRGYVAHTQYEFGSILKFIEDNWNLGQLGTTDVRAHDILDCFDFSQKPRAFVPISATYPESYFERRPPSGLPVDTE